MEGWGVRRLGRHLSVSFRTLCVAIPVPEPWGAEIDRARRALQPGRQPLRSHITLIPPTDVPVDRVPEVLVHVSAVARAETGFRVELRGTGTFRPCSPVVFIGVVGGHGDVVALRDELAVGRFAPKEGGWPFQPHVTLAARCADQALDDAARWFEDFSALFEVRSVSTFEKVNRGWAVRDRASIGS